MRSLHLFVLSACAASSLGCAVAMMPGMPAGPIASPGIRAGANYSYARAPGTAQATAAGSNVVVRGNSAMLVGSTVALFPSNIGVRVAPSQSIDLGLDLGWHETGLKVRAGQLAASRAVPWGVELEWRSGLAGWNGSESLERKRNIVRLRAEAYPALRFPGSDEDPADLFGVLALGVSTGTQLLSVQGVSGDYDESYFFGPTPSLNGLRWETRLEAALGLHWLPQPGGFTLVFLPWWRLHQGKIIDTECVSCSLDVASAESSWGFGLGLSGFWQAR